MNWSYRSKTLLVLFLLTASALISVPLFRGLTPLRTASAVACYVNNTCNNTPGCFSPYDPISTGYFNDQACYMRDVFGLDYLNGGANYNSNQLTTVQWGSYTGASVQSTQSQGELINVESSNGNWGNNFLRTLSSYTWNGTWDLAVATELAKQTSNPSGDGYYATLAISPSSSSISNSNIQVQITDSSAGQYLTLNVDDSGTSQTLYTSSNGGYDWAVIALTLGSTNGYADTLTLQANSYNSGDPNSGNWETLYNSTSAPLPITSGYVYLGAATDSPSPVQISSRFLSVTSENAEVDASIGMSLAYTARAYEPVSSANNNPMAVISDVPYPSLSTVDTSNSRDTRMSGQPGVTNVVDFTSLPQECVTNPCQDLGTRALSLWQNGEEMLYSFSEPQQIAGTVDYHSDPPYIVLILNETSPNPLTTTYSAEELAYNTGGDNVNVYLGGQLLFSGDQTGKTVSFTVPVGTFGQRYVARHVTRVMANIFQELGYTSFSSALNNFMNYYGYGQDFYDSMFYYGSMNYNDNYLWASSTFPDPSTFSSLPSSESSTGTGYWPYQSRLTIQQANNLYTHDILMLFAKMGSLSKFLHCYCLIGLKHSYHALHSAANNRPSHS